MEDFQLPLVSIVVVNFNYGKFIENALRSAAEQTYPRVETVIVDDQSTDDSWNIIEELTAISGMFPSVTAHQTSVNSGQSVAAELGLSRCTGQYVVLLDADDVLLPHCVEAHIFAHLSSRISVGFSSVDVITEVQGQCVASAHADVSAYIASREEPHPGLIRPIDAALPASWFGSRPPILTARDIHYVMPPACDWVWSPMSGNCYRRRALETYLEGPALHRIRWGTDLYLNRVISASHGSMIIDKPLMVYRMHGGNEFTKSAPLYQQLDFDKSRQEEMIGHMKEGVLKMFDVVERQGSHFIDSRSFLAAVKSQCRSWPVLKSESGGDFLLECLHRYQPVLSRIFGAETVRWWIKENALPGRSAAITKFFRPRA